MTDREAFLSAIIAAPRDDLPRLVYADWLEEHGESERAEFIRWQCEDYYNRYTQGPMEAEGKIVIGDRSLNWSRASGIIDDSANDLTATFLRGFIATLNGSIAALLEYGPKICLEHPVVEVVVSESPIQSRNRSWCVVVPPEINRRELACGFQSRREAEKYQNRAVYDVIRRRASLLAASSPNG